MKETNNFDYINIIREYENQISNISLSIKNSFYLNALNKLWTFPGKNRVQIDTEYSFFKNEKISFFTKLSKKIINFREDITETYCVFLPSLIILLKRIEIIFEAYSSRYEYNDILNSLQKALDSFLEDGNNTSNLKHLTRYGKEDSGLIFKACNPQKEAFIVSNGLLRNYFLNYDEISNNSCKSNDNLIAKYYGIINKIRKSTGDQDLLLIFPRKTYGPVGPVGDITKFQEKIQADGLNLETIIYNCFELDSKKFESSNLSPENFKNICIVYDLIYSGNGILEPFYELRRICENPCLEKAYAIVLTAEKSDLTINFDEKNNNHVNVSIEEIFAYNKYQNLFDKFDYTDNLVEPNIANKIYLQQKPNIFTPFREALSILTFRKLER